MVNQFYFKLQKYKLSFIIAIILLILFSVDIFVLLL